MEQLLDANHSDDVARDELVVQLLAQGKEDASATVDAAIAAGWSTWIAGCLTETGYPLIDAAALYELVADLHSHGEIRRPLSLLEEYDERVSSARLREFRARREYDLASLDRRFEVPVPRVRGFEPSTDWHSLYLLHNSLPFQSAGYATRTHGLLSGLVRLGYRVAGVTRPGFPSTRGQFNQQRGISPTDVIGDVTYHRLVGPVDAQPRRDLANWVQLYGSMLQGLLDEFRPPILHAASSWWNGHAAVGVARAVGVKSIYEIRGLWEITRASRVDGWMDSEVYQLDADRETQAAVNADHVFTITNGLHQELVRRGIPAERMTIVPNAVDIDRFSPRNRDADLESRLDLIGMRVVGFVGTLTEYEGLDDLLDAVVMLNGETESPFVVLFVGDGPVQPELEAKARELGIDKLCRFVGRVPHEEVERYLSLIDITPFPRKPLPVCEMVSPLKPLESMASGIAVMSSDVEALDEMLGRGTYGLTFRKGDTAHLAESLGMMIDDRELCAELTGKALDWVRTERNWQAVARIVADVYDRLIEE